LARIGASVTAIDACKENILAAQLRAQKQFEDSNGELKFYERLNYLNCKIGQTHTHTHTQSNSIQIFKLFFFFFNTLSGTIEELAAIDDNKSYFDAIVMSEVVEHVNNLKDFLFNATHLLKVIDYVN
jgi:2-polyprenyl-3-methyl-5-hydroxy-6-metoxy-1,4-benzoquinol methylase